MLSRKTSQNPWLSSINYQSRQFFFFFLQNTKASALLSLHKVKPRHQSNDLVINTCMSCFLGFMLDLIQWHPDLPIEVLTILVAG